MKLIVCLDDFGGMLFNNRRQSRDRVLIEDIMLDIVDKKIYILGYSKILFEMHVGRYKIVDDFLSLADTDAICFVENVSVKSLIDKVDSVTVYNWNRVYPRDFVFDIDLKKEGFFMASSYEFEGYSHENIRKEVYKR